MESTPATPGRGGSRWSGRWQPGGASAASAARWRRGSRNLARGRRGATLPFSDLTPLDAAYARDKGAAKHCRNRRSPCIYSMPCCLAASHRAARAVAECVYSLVTQSPPPPVCAGTPMTPLLETVRGRDRNETGSRSAGASKYWRLLTCIRCVHALGWPSHPDAVALACVTECGVAWPGLGRAGCVHGYSNG